MTTKAEEYLHNAEVPIEFEDAREESLVRQAALGEDALSWLESPVGRFVCGAAVQDQREIEILLPTIRPNTPWRRRRIVDLQQKHEAITLAIGWITEQVTLGAAAKRELHTVNE